MRVALGNWKDVQVAGSVSSEGFVTESRRNPKFLILPVLM